MSSPKELPTPQQRREIAALALTPERTVLLCYQDPTHRKPAVMLRVSRAARELGVLPPGDTESGPEAA